MSYNRMHEAALRAEYKQGVDALWNLIEEGWSVNCLDGFHDTPLHKAARIGNDGACRLLLSEGSHVNAKNAFGFTPLHYAVMYANNQLGSVPACKSLLVYGADPFAKDQAGFKPTMTTGTEGVKTVIYDAAFQCSTVLTRGKDANARQLRYHCRTCYPNIINENDVIQYLICGGCRMSCHEDHVVVAHSHCNISCCCVQTESCVLRIMRPAETAVIFNRVSDDIDQFNEARLEYKKMKQHLYLKEKEKMEEISIARELVMKAELEYTNAYNEFDFEMRRVALVKKSSIGVGWVQKTTPKQSKETPINTNNDNDEQQLFPSFLTRAPSFLFNNSSNFQKD